MSALNFVTTLSVFLVTAATALPVLAQSSDAQGCLMPASNRQRLLLKATIETNSQSRQNTVAAVKPRALLKTAPAADDSGQAQQQVRQIAAMLAKYKAGERPRQMMYTGPARRQQIATLSHVAPPQETAALPAQYQPRIIPRPDSGTAVRLSGRATASLPRWGDKACACHDALRLYQQHRYMEAAQKYAQAADNMLKAWGRPTVDVANAWRGQAVCLGAAGHAAEARALFLKASRAYIQEGGAAQSAIISDTLRDLSDTYRELGQPQLSNALSAALPRIQSLLPNRKQDALAELNRRVAN